MKIKMEIVLGIDFHKFVLLITSWDKVTFVYLNLINKLNHVKIKLIPNGYTVNSNSLVNDTQII